MILHLQQPYPSPSIIQPNTRAIDPPIHHERRRLPDPPLDLVRPRRGVAVPAERRELVVDQADVAVFSVAGVGVGLAFDDAGEVAVQGAVVAEFVLGVVQDGEVAGDGAEEGGVEDGAGGVVGGAFGAGEDVSIPRLGFRKLEKLLTPICRESRRLKGRCCWLGEQQLLPGRLGRKG